MTSVFLSYARDDDEPFVRRLYQDLTAAGFDVWFDRECMPSRQLTFHQEIADAIRGRDRHVLVVGPQAALSDYVRQEWRWALELDKSVIPILRCGDYTHIPGELSALHCEDFRDDTQYPAALAKLIDNLNRPAPPLGALMGVPSLPAHFLGRPELLRRVKDALLVDLQSPVVVSGAGAQVGVQGMGGIGKSVLAAALARDPEIRRAYPDGIIWVAMGQHPSLVSLQLQVAGHLGSPEVFTTEPEGQGVLRQLLLDKSVLLILDDVWKARDVQAFDVLGPRCRALVTTRDAGVLHSLHGQSVPVELFTEDEALALLADEVGLERAALPPEGQEIVRECGCLPLAVALCGGMVKKRGEWGPVLERLRRADLEKIADREAINEQHQSIWRAMQASVDELTPDEQRRFAELAVFATDQPVPEAAVATLWAHTGDLDDLDTTDLLVDLAERSLIRLGQKAAADSTGVARHISLHDLLYDFATRLAGDPVVLHGDLVEAYRAKCPEGWATGPNDGYFLQRLVHHLIAAGRQDELAPLLTDYRFLDTKLRGVSVQGLTEDYERAETAPGLGEEEARSLRLIGGALRLSAHVVGPDPDQLPSQLWGRMQNCLEVDIQALLRHARDSQDGPWLQPLTASFAAPGGPLLRTLTGHSGGVNAVAVTPDGHQVISGSWDNTLKVWDLEAGVELRTLTGHGGMVNAVAVTADGCRAVSGSSDHTLKVWDLESGAELRTLAGHSSYVTAVAVTADGRRAVSASGDTTLKVWDLESGAELRTLTGHGFPVTAVAVTADGRRAVSASLDHALKVWNLENGAELRTLTGHGFPVHAVAVTPDGRRAVSGSLHSPLKVWDLESGAELRTLAGHGNAVTAVAVTADGRRAVSASHDKTLKLWDLESGAELRTLTGHSDGVRSLAVTADGRRAVSASDDETLKVWDLESGAELRTLTGHSVAVYSAAVTPDGGRAVSASWDRTLKLWDLDTGAELRTLAGHTKEVFAVAVTADGRRAVSASHDKTLKLWDLDSGAETRTLSGHTDRPWAVAIPAHGCQAISASSDRTVRVWDLDTGAELHTLTGHSDGVGAVAVMPDGRRAISASDDRTLKVWSLDTGAELRTLTGHGGSVNAVAVTADGRRAVSASWDKTLKVWDLVSERVLCTFSTESRPAACAVAPDGVTIVAGDAGGRMYFLRLENVTPGPPIITAWLSADDSAPAFGCLHCRVWSEVPTSALGTELPCPNCGKAIKLNPFVIEADWRPVAAAWRGDESA